MKKLLLFLAFSVSVFAFEKGADVSILNDVANNLLWKATYLVETMAVNSNVSILIGTRATNAYLDMVIQSRNQAGSLDVKLYSGVQFTNGTNWTNYIAANYFPGSTSNQKATSTYDLACLSFVPSGIGQPIYTAIKGSQNLVTGWTMLSNLGTNAISFVANLQGDFQNLDLTEAPLLLNKYSFYLLQVSNSSSTSTNVSASIQLQFRIKQ